jgi:TM2 domain-containing membrane protein YozV
VTTPTHGQPSEDTPKQAHWFDPTPMPFPAPAHPANGYEVSGHDVAGPEAHGYDAHGYDQTPAYDPTPVYPQSPVAPTVPQLPAQPPAPPVYPPTVAAPASPSAAYATQAAYPTSAPYGVHPLTGQAYSDKSKIVAGLLQLVPGFVLGLGGLGRLYAGHTSLGVIQLLATLLGWASVCAASLIFPLAIFGGVWLWFVVDGIVLMAGSPSDKYGRRLRA